MDKAGLRNPGRAVASLRILGSVFLQKREKTKKRTKEEDVFHASITLFSILVRNMVSKHSPQNALANFRCGNIEAFIRPPVPILNTEDSHKALRMRSKTNASAL